MKTRTKISRVGLVLAMTFFTLAAVTEAGASTKVSTTRGRTFHASARLGPSALRAIPSLVKMVPARFRHEVLTIGTDATYPPDEFTSASGQIIGFEPELMIDVAKVLDLRIKIVNAGFDTLIPGLENGRYQILASAIGIHPDREKIFDEIWDFKSGDALMLKAGSSLHITSMASLCGISVGVETGSTYQGDLQTQSKKCQSLGKKAIQIHAYPDQNTVQLALASGRVQVSVNDQGVANYEVHQLHQGFIVAASYNVNPNGVAVTKSSGLARPIAAAIQAIIKNGAYQQLLNKWQMKGEGITRATINGIGYPAGA
ncbi:MAG: transporter substrate-binding domain-containing protein [Sulfobacillus sp.]